MSFLYLANFIERGGEAFVLVISGVSSLSVLSSLRREHRIQLTFCLPTPLAAYIRIVRRLADGEPVRDLEITVKVQPCRPAQHGRKSAVQVLLVHGSMKAPCHVPFPAHRHSPRFEETFAKKYSALAKPRRARKEAFALRGVIRSLAVQQGHDAVQTFVPFVNMVLPQLLSSLHSLAKVCS